MYDTIGSALNFLIGGLLLATFVVVSRSILGTRITVGSEPTRRTFDPRELLPAFVAAAALGIFGFYGFFMAHGVPVLRHDWSWPVDDVELRRFYATIASPWNVGGAGAASVFPAMYALAWCMSALGTILSTKTVLDVLLGGAFVAAFLGIYFIARTDPLDPIRPLGALVAATAYAVSPFFLNEFVAGHVLNVVAYSLLPALAALSLSAEFEQKRERFVARAILAGLVVGFSAIQIQYLAFDALLLLLLTVTSRKSGRFVLFSLLALIVGSATQAFTLGNLLVPSAAGIDLPPPVTLQWFHDMSVQPRLALFGYGYIADYARQTFVWDMTDRLWQVAAFAALVPVAVTLLVRRAARWPLICLVGIFFASGILGPAGELKAWFFGHVLAAGLVRELYNFTCLTSLGLALCLGSTVDWFARGTTRAPALAARVAVGALTLFALFVLAYPFAHRRTLDFLYLWSPSANYERLDSELKDPVARVVFLPSAQPLHSDRTKDGIFSFAGSDMWGYEFRGHPVAFEYIPTGPVALAWSALGHENYRYAAQVLGLLGTRYFIARHDIRSYAPRFWLPQFFPPTWGKGMSLGGLTPGDASLLKTTSNSEFDVYENREYRPIVSIASATFSCDRSVAFQAMFGDVSECRVGRAVAPELRLLPAPDNDTYTAVDGWVSAQPFSMVNESLAEHWQSIFTESSRPHLERVRLKERLSLFASCQAATAAKVTVDENMVVSLRCAPFRSRKDQWQEIAKLPAGPHTLLIEKKPGPMVFNPLVGRRSSSVQSGAFDPVDVAVLPRHDSAQLTPTASVSFERRAGHWLTGTVTCAKPCFLVFTETFSPQWTLTLQGNAPIPSRQINLTQNAFNVPAGSHLFNLEYRPPPLNRVLLGIGNSSWLVAGVAVVGLWALGLLRTRKVVAREGSQIGASR